MNNRGKEKIEKYCCKCDKVLPIEFFYRDKRHKYYYQGYCKDCSNEYQKAYKRRKREENRRIKGV